jgi:hypothetical protein
MKEQIIELKKSYQKKLEDAKYNEKIFEDSGLKSGLDQTSAFIRAYSNFILALDKILDLENQKPVSGGESEAISL